MHFKPTTPQIDLDALRQHYDHDGFCVIPELFPAPLVARAAYAAEVVASGETATGLPPRLLEEKAVDGRQTLIKVAEPHNASYDLRRLITYPRPWRAIAAIINARMLQVWAVDLFIKRAEPTTRANIGWHQDGPFAPYWRGDIFTVWLALTDVTSDSSPLRYIRGSHRLGPLRKADLFRTDLDLARAGLDLPQGFDAGEVAVKLPPGGIVMHQRNTLHASGPNTSTRSRMSLAIRVRTDLCELIENVSQVAHLDDLELAPVVFNDQLPAGANRR
jgi:ectoine hydroxylase-related dioxygenase (phytanoyl-CoA dioxygenase family)